MCDKCKMRFRWEPETSFSQETRPRHVTYDVSGIDVEASSLFSCQTFKQTGIGGFQRAAEQQEKFGAALDWACGSAGGLRWRRGAFFSYVSSPLLARSAEIHTFTFRPPLGRNSFARLLCFSPPSLFLSHFSFALFFRLLASLQFSLSLFLSRLSLKQRLNPFLSVLAAPAQPFTTERLVVVAAVSEWSDLCCCFFCPAQIFLFLFIITSKWP